MDIRLARAEELATLQDIFGFARAQMRKGGNSVQWVNGYPSDGLLLADIAAGNLYVMEDEDGVHAVFAFIEGEDPTYKVIEEGAWLNDEPYGTIHRVASDGTVHGVVRQAVAFALQRVGNVRIDTHASNTAMRAAVAKAGFSECGIITIADGTKRVAYHLAAGARA